MKYLSLLIVLLLISFMNSQTDDKNYCDEKEVTDSSKCKDLTLPPGFSNCCFYHVEGSENGGETETFKACIPLNKTQYENINDYIKELEEGAEEGISLDVKTLDCFANYLQISIITLLILII